MNRSMLAAALAAALFGLEAQAQTSTPSQTGERQWSASFTAGGYDLSGHFVGGTEIRQFAVWNAASTTYSSSPTSGPKLFAGNGYTQDHPGPEGKQNAQVLRLDGPESRGYAWQQDVSFGGSFCPTSSPCASYTSALAAFNFTADVDGNPANTTVIEASTLWEGDATSICSGTNVPVYTFSRNPYDGQWSQDNVVCSNAGFAIRSYGTHVDQVTGAGYAFAGVDDAGVWHGQLQTGLTSGEDPMVWTTGAGNEELNSTALYSGPSCTSGLLRAMSFAEATGADNVRRLYVDICFQIFVRIDGPQGSCNAQQVYLGGSCQSRWTLYWTDPTPASNSGSGVRGLTEVEYSGSSTLLVGADGGPTEQYRIIPYVPGGCNVMPSTCYKLEYTNAPPPGISIESYVSPFNEWSPWYSGNGVAYNFGGQGMHVAKTQSLYLPAGTTYQYFGKTNTETTFRSRAIGEAYLLRRNSAGRYNVSVLPDNLFSTPLGAVRDVVASPFWSECNGGSAPIRNGCVIYVGGYDVSGSPYYYWCQTNPCAASGSIPWVGQHNTAWIARYGWEK